MSRHEKKELLPSYMSPNRAGPYAENTLPACRSSRMDSALDALQSSVFSVGKIVAACGFGLVWAKYLVNSPDTFRDMSRLSTHILIPSMIIEKLVVSLEVNDFLTKTWLLPVLALLFVFTGFCVGTSLSFLTPQRLRPLVICSAMFPNAIGMSLPIMGSLTQSVEWLRQDPDSLEDAISYLFMINIVYSGLMWSLGFSITSRLAEKQVYRGIDERNPEGVQGTETAVPSSSGTFPDEERVRRRSLSGSTNDDEVRVVQMMPENGEEAGLQDSSMESWRSNFLKKAKVVILNMCTPPFLSTLVGITIGLSPLRGLLYSTSTDGKNTAPLSFAIDVMRFLNSATIPMVTLLLGSSMAKKPDQGLAKSTIIASILGRLLLTPSVCFLAIHLLVVSGVIPAERVFLLCLLIISSNPSAMNLGVMCSMHGGGHREMVAITFWMYMASIPAVTMWTTISLRYVEWIIPQ